MADDPLFIQNSIASKAPKDASGLSVEQKAEWISALGLGDILTGGTAGQVWTSAGSGGAASWQNPSIL